MTITATGINGCTATKTYIVKNVSNFRMEMAQNILRDDKAANELSELLKKVDALTQKLDEKND